MKNVNSLYHIYLLEVVHVLFPTEAAKHSKHFDVTFISLYRGHIHL